MEANRFCPHCMSEQRKYGEYCFACGERLDSRNASHQLRVGTVLKGRYLVGSALGEGGFGITYIGLDLVLRQRVAIKEFFPDGAANRSGEGRVISVSGSAGESFGIGMEHFMNEGKILSQFVGDPNVVTVRDWFEENGTAYIVMEYIAGKNLQQLLEERGKLPFDEAMSIVRPAAECLGRIHKQGIIHGDISPSNIMVSEGGTVKLLDFGTARVGGRRKEGELSLMLKPGYAPEETYRQNSELGPRLDIYALSATLYKLLTGVTPETAQDRMFNECLIPPGKSGAKLTRAQEAGLMKGMALRAENRPESMDELLMLLGRDRLSLSDRLRSGSGKALIAAVCAVLVLGGAFFAVRAGGGNKPKPPVSSPGSKSENTDENKTPSERLKTRSENAYPIAISSGMEPMEGFKRQKLSNERAISIAATACYVGNTQLCLEFEIENRGETRISCSLNGLCIQEYEFEPEFEYLNILPGEKKTVGMWLNLDLVSIPLTTIEELTPDFFVSSLQQQGDYSHFEVNTPVRLPERIILPRWKIAQAYPVYKYSDEDCDCSMEFLGLSLRKDDFRGEMLWRVTVKSKDKVYESLSVRSFSVTKLKADGVSIDQNALGYGPYIYASTIDSNNNTAYFSVPFYYCNSRYVHPDEMNVYHSNLELPKELEIELSYERRNGDYDDGKEYECTFSSVFAVLEDGTGYINGDTRKSEKPMQ